jgi:hypothetical protein
VDHREIRLKNVDWVYQAQVRDHGGGGGGVNLAMSLWVHKTQDISWLAERLPSSEEDLYFRELVYSSTSTGSNVFIEILLHVFQHVASKYI